MQLDVHDAALLHDMLDSTRRALTYAGGRSRADLDSDPMFADAVVRRIEIVGEAVRGVSDEVRTNNPDVHWRAIMATRHILAHDYDEVNHDIVWRIVKEHLPPLISQLEILLRSAPRPAAD